MQLHQLIHVKTGENNNQTNIPLFARNTPLLSIEYRYFHDFQKLAMVNWGSIHLRTSNGVAGTSVNTSRATFCC